MVSGKCLESIWKVKLRLDQIGTGQVGTGQVGNKSSQNRSSWNRSIRDRSSQTGSVKWGEVKMGQVMSGLVRLRQDKSKFNKFSDCIFLQHLGTTSKFQLYLKSCKLGTRVWPYSVQLVYHFIFLQKIFGGPIAITLSSDGWGGELKFLCPKKNCCCAS